MQNMPQSISPEHILEIIIRRRWLLIIPFCIALMIGIYFALTLPKIYMSSTLILVQPQRVPSNYVKPIVSSDIASRLRTISQQILSQTNIQRIIDQFRLFTEPEQKNIFIEDRIEAVRNRIKVNVSQSNTFSVSFKGREPAKVRDIANALATYFIDENLKVRESQALGTSTFLDDELESLRGKLEEKEEALRQYRKNYMGELPDQLQTNLSMLRRLSENLIEKQKVLRESKSALNSMQTQISESQKVQSMLPFEDFDLGESGIQESAQLSHLKKSLAALKMRYTDQHPDVARLKSMIAKLEEEQKAAGESTEAGLEGIEDGLPQFDVMTLQKTQLNEASQQVKWIESEIVELNSKIAMYQQRIDDTPKRQEELLSITRDYDNMKKSYSTLMSRRLEAQISVNMEKKQKGEQFQIIDPARLPEKPISPNMKRLFLITIISGLSIGAGTVFILEYLNTAFQSPADIETNLGLSILATVPLVLSPKQKRMQRLLNIASIVAVGFSILLFVGFSVITLTGPENTFEFIHKFI